MTDIVINKCYGGFCLSDKAMEHYLKLKGIPYETSAPKYSFKDSKNYWHAGHVGNIDYCISDRDFDRNDPALIQTIKDLGEEANDRYSDLTIITIPDDVEWQIQEYDGSEWIAEKHRVWK